MSRTGTQDWLFDQFATRRASHPHDLPPRWDGCRVEWDGWREWDGLFVCPPRRSAESTCEECGAKRVFACNQGRVVDPSAGTPHHLTARRCPVCGLDYVECFTPDGVVTWVLESCDYGDLGSRA